MFEAIIVIGTLIFIFGIVKFSLLVAFVIAIGIIVVGLTSAFVPMLLLLIPIAIIYLLLKN